MNVLAWSNGIKPERSQKKNKPVEYTCTPVEKPCTPVEKTGTPVEKTGTPAENICKPDVPDVKTCTPTSYNKDFAYDYKLTNMETINTFDMTDNRREIFNNKLSTREVISKPCANPFLTHLNYSNDILQQERFLIPKNSNMEKEYSR